MKTKKNLLIIFVITFLMIISHQIKVQANTIDGSASTITQSENSTHASDNGYCVTKGVDFGKYGMNTEYTFQKVSQIDYNGSTNTATVNGKDQGTNRTAVFSQMIAVQMGALGSEGGMGDSTSQNAIWELAGSLDATNIGFPENSHNQNALKGDSASKMWNTTNNYVQEGNLQNINATISVYQVVGTSKNIQTLIVINTEEVTPTPTPSPTLTPTPTPTPTPRPPDPDDYCYITKSTDPPYLRSITEKDHQIIKETRTQYDATKGTDTDGKVTISGYVWKDAAEGKGNQANKVKSDDEEGIENIKVVWKTADGSEILAEGYTNADGYYELKADLIYKQHSYEITQEQFDRITNSYVEFEYNGLKYTTTAYEQGGASANTSKAKENEEERKALDEKFDYISPDSEDSVTVTDTYIIGYDADKKPILNNFVAEYCLPDGSYMTIETDTFGNTYVNGKLAKIETTGDKKYISYGDIQYDSYKSYYGIDVENNEYITRDDFGYYYIKDQLVKIEYDSNGTAYALLALLDSSGLPIIQYGERIELMKQENNDLTVTASTKGIIGNLIGFRNDYICEPGAESQALYTKNETTTKSTSSGAYAYHEGLLNDVCVWHCSEKHLYWHADQAGHWEVSPHDAHESRYDCGNHSEAPHQYDCVLPVICTYTKVYEYWHHYRLYGWNPSCNCGYWETDRYQDEDGKWHTERYWVYDCKCTGVCSKCGGCPCHSATLIAEGEEYDHTEYVSATHLVPGPCDGDCCLDIRKRVTGWEITNVNLGLIEKEQPDLAITSDIDHVNTVMNDQVYTYEYNYRKQMTQSELDENGYEEMFKTVFQDKTLTSYRRPVNPADIAYISKEGNDKEALQVYVTYKVTVHNHSNTLITKVNRIENYFDTKYTLCTTDKKIVEKDVNYTLAIDSPDNYKGVDEWNYEGEKITGKFNEASYTWGGQGIELQPATSATVYIQLRVKTEYLKSLMTQDDVPLNDVSEIYSYTTKYGSNTICAELEEAKKKNPDRTRSLYSGVDRNSIVGNIDSRGLLDRIGPVTSEGTMSGVSKDEFEDDEDCAPTFYLEKDEYKVISGTIYEDQTSYDDENGRLGSGQKEDDEQGIENVKVELLLVDYKTGQVIIEDEKEKVADLYYINDKGESASKPAVTYTDKDGNYSFGDNGKGVVVDYYVIRYTYGNDEEKLVEGLTDEQKTQMRKVKVSKEDKIATTLDQTTGINARNYKSTIITDKEVSSAMKEQNNDKWHLKTTDNYSVAVDDLNARLSIEDMYNGNYKDSQNMVAYTPPFKVQIEYTKTQDNQSSRDGQSYTNKLEEGESAANLIDSVFEEFKEEWTVFDFGIAERAKEDLQLDKTISYVRITLANGQILLAGDPRKEDISYVKTMGIKNSSSSAYGRELSAEIDSELIQGATLEIQYAITLTNNSEKDYEFEYQYGANIQEGDKESISGNELYPDITGGEGVPTIEDITIIKDPTGKYITTYSEANYYYYGVINENHPLIKSTVDWVVDYLDPQLTCTVGKEAENDKGDIQVNSKTYKDKYGNENAYIWEKVEPLAGETTEDGNTIKTIKTAAAKLANEKLISSTVKDALGGESKENYLILKTNAFWDVEAGNSKTIYLYASKLLGSQSDDYVYDNHAEIVQIESKIARTKGYMNKSYTPGEYIPQFGRVQQDDDMVRVVITPPTGTTTNINIYAIVGAISLIVIAGGVIFIKKKVIG